MVKVEFQGETLDDVLSQIASYDGGSTTRRAVSNAAPAMAEKPKKESKTEEKAGSAASGTRVTLEQVRKIAVTKKGAKAVLTKLGCEALADIPEDKLEEAYTEFSKLADK